MSSKINIFVSSFITLCKVTLEALIYTACLHATEQHMVNIRWQKCIYCQSKFCMSVICQQPTRKTKLLDIYTAVWKTNISHNFKLW